MKAFLSILLSLLVLVCATSKAWVYMAFKLNQSYIAAELCENRFEPLLLCSGTCYLDKQLDALDEKEQNSNPVQQYDTKDFHFPSLQQEELAKPLTAVNLTVYAVITWKSSSYTPGLLKPPRLFLLS